MRQKPNTSSDTRATLARLRTLRHETGGPHPFAAEASVTRSEASRPAFPVISSGPADNRRSSWHTGLSRQDGLLRIDTLVPYGTRHGTAVLSPPPIEALSHFGLDGRRNPVTDGRTAGTGPVVLDCETTGLSTGAGTLAFLIGIARYTDRGLSLTQLVLDRIGDEQAQLHGLGTELALATGLVTYNGKAFDLTLLSVRHRLHRLEDAPRRLIQLDLLHPVRRTFGHCWPDAKLGTVERRLFGLVRHDDIPGADIPGVWREWLAGRDYHDRMAGVLAHNRTDLLTTALLPEALWIAQMDPETSGAYPAAAALELLKAKRAEAALRDLLAREPRLTGSALHLLATLARKAGHQAPALRAWKRLADEGDREAMIALAKHFEHRAKHYQQALRWTALAFARDPSCTETSARMRRLERKLAASRTHTRANRAGEDPVAL